MNQAASAVSVASVASVETVIGFQILRMRSPLLTHQAATTVAAVATDT